MYGDVVNVQPCFNFSDEIIILNSTTLNTVTGTWNVEAPFILGLLFRIKFKESLSSL